jgi:hypothetical protein
MAALLVDTRPREPVRAGLLQKVLQEIHLVTA